MALVPYDDRDGFIWFDGKLVPWRDAKIHVLTHALHYGSGVFEGERAYGGVIFKSREHSQRLKDSAKILDFEVPWTVAEIDAAKLTVMAANGHTNCYVRPVAWRGSEEMGVGAQPTPSTWRSPPGNGRAISTPSCARRASGSTSPTTAAPTPRPRPPPPRRPAST